MIDKAVAEDLFKAKGQIQNCISIYADELKRRHDRSKSKIVGLAPDADIIYGYLHPRVHRDFPTAAIEALLQTDAVRTLVLPGVQMEIEQLYRVHLLALGDPLYGRRFNPADAGSREGRKEILENLKYEVGLLCDKLTDARRAMDRLLRFLSSPCVNPKNWADVDLAVFEPSDGEVEDIFSELLRVRQPGRNRRSLVDSRNVATVLSAARNGVLVPLVTNTHAVFHSFETKIRPNQPASEGLVIGPFTAITIISLAHASTADIGHLRQSASALLSMMESAEPNGTVDLLTEFSEYMQFTYYLAEIGSLINRTWVQPETNLPDDLDLKHLAAIALEQVQALTRKLTEISKRFGFSPEDRTTPAIVVQEAARNAVLNVELLKDIQTGDDRIIIQKLIIFNEGAQMSEYNINQTGSNLTAIVDSFKTTQLLESGFSNEVESQIKTLLDSIVASNLPEEEKKDVIDAATTVVEDVKKDGRLAGTAKMLWGGLRETIKSVPAALAAWDALQKHWH